MTDSSTAPPPRHRDRVRARAWALQVHYRWESQGPDGSLVEALEETLRQRYVAEPRRPYLRRLVETLDRHLRDVDSAVGECLENWRLDRLASIDRGVLRIFATEILYFEDVPLKVSIKEAVRLAERYGSDESSTFVNGVLDGLASRVRAESAGTR